MSDGLKLVPTNEVAEQESHWAALLREPVSPRVHPDDDERLAREAVFVRGRRAATRRRRIALGTMMAAAAVALVAATEFQRRAESSTDVALVSKHRAPKTFAALTLASGDRIETSHDAKVRVIQTGATDTVVALDEGTALFDIARRAPEQRFFVFAGQHVVEVTGTVFVVHVHESGAEVELFEGNVNVRRVSEVCSANQAYACRDAALVRAMNPGMRVAVIDSGTANDVQRGSDLLTLRAAALVPNRQGRANVPTPHAQVARSPTPDSNSVQPQSRRDAEQALAEGRYADAVAIARARIVREPTSARAAWWVLLADGERGMGHRDAAADAYERALTASTLAPTQRASIAVSLAQLCLQGSAPRDAERALVALRAANATQANSATERIATRLEVQALRRLQRTDEADRLESLTRNRFGE